MHGVTVGVGGFRERRRGCPRVPAAQSLPTAVDSSWLRVGVGVGVELGVGVGVGVGVGFRRLSHACDTHVDARGLVRVRARVKVRVSWG